MAKYAAEVAVPMNAASAIEGAQRAVQALGWHTDEFYPDGGFACRPKWWDRDQIKVGVNALGNTTVLSLNGSAIAINLGDLQERVLELAAKIRVELGLPEPASATGQPEAFGRPEPMPGDGGGDGGGGGGDDGEAPDPPDSPVPDVAEKNAELREAVAERQRRAAIRAEIQRLEAELPQASLQRRPDITARIHQLYAEMG